MSLVSSTPLLVRGRERGYAVPAFNVHTVEMLQSVVLAASEMRSPLILQTTVGTVRNFGANMLVAIATSAGRQVDIPIALHLDHCTDEQLIYQCLRAGYTSVMMDASMRPFEENLERTSQVVKAAAAMGVNVEAELGAVGGVEDDIHVDEASAFLADPEQCERFVEATGVPTLAPAIGTAHGMYRGEPNVDFGRLAEVARRVSVPLVLHGGSGLSEQVLKTAISHGVAKVNVATELKIAFTNALREFFADDPNESDPRKYMVPAKEAVKNLAMAKIELLGSAGQA